jgi:hypothetical protein
MHRLLDGDLHSWVQVLVVAHEYPVSFHRDGTPTAGFSGVAGSE